MVRATFERVNELLRYEPETGKLYWKISRKGVKGAGSEAGGLNCDGYITVGIEGKKYYAHRVAHLLVNKVWPDRDPEHENLIKSDNRWENIKDLATGSENMGNRVAYSNNTSGLKGVSWFKRDKKWQVHVGINGTAIGVGYFEDHRLAGLTYDAAAKAVWGLRFSNLNFPTEESDHIVLPDRVIRRIEAQRGYQHGYQEQARPIGGFL
jgi:hypothetical protein